MKLSLQSSRAVAVAFTVVVFAVTGCNKSNSDSNPYVPVLTTGAIVTDISTTSFQGNGYITNFISGTIASYGICYSSTNKTPTISDSKTSLTTANVIHFVSTVTGLTANTTYYFRAYETGSDNTSNYGNVVQFTTPTATFAIAGTTSTYAGTGTPGYADGPAKSALFSSPQGIVADAAGNLYVTDSFNNLIRKISSTGVVTTLAGSTSPGLANGTGTAARFYSPQGITIDASGNLYVSDVGNNTIRKITQAGVVTTLAGNTIPGYADGTGTSAKFNNPAGLVADATGNIYVCDKGNNIIRKITPAGVVTTFTGGTTPGLADGINTLNSDGTTTDTKFSSPAGIAIDSQGILYVADLGNGAIRQIGLDGTVTTIAGNPTTRPDLLNYPVGIAVDNKGNLFITDEAGRVMEITATNRGLYTIAGTANTTGYTEGKGATAVFNDPQGLAVDAAGNVYVADLNNNVIRKLVVSVTP